MGFANKGLKGCRSRFIEIIHGSAILNFLNLNEDL